MLAELTRETAPLAGQTSPPLEMLLMYSRDAFDPGPVAAMVAAAFGPDHPIQPRLVPMEGLDYCTQKNAGAREASNEIVVFLDSDVVPEDGCLAGLLEAMRYPAVAVVGGATHVTAEGLYGKAFSLFWFFPSRDPGANGLETEPLFYANNVAFRRDLFLRTDFPEARTLRGQCVTLATQLQREGFEIYRNGSSRVAHPPPNGFGHFVRRALSAGHDAAVETPPGASPARTAYWRLRGALIDSARRIRAGRSAVGLSQAGAVAAFGIAAAHHALVLVGELATRRAPKFVPRYAPI